MYVPLWSTYLNYYNYSELFLFQWYDPMTSILGNEDLSGKSHLCTLIALCKRAGHHTDGVDSYSPKACAILNVLGLKVLEDSLLLGYKMH